MACGAYLGAIFLQEIKAATDADIRLAQTCVALHTMQWTDYKDGAEVINSKYHTIMTLLEGTQRAKHTHARTGAVTPASCAAKKTMGEGHRPSTQQSPGNGRDQKKTKSRNLVSQHG